VRAGAGDEFRRLPAGPHGIPADVVARNQRERLVAAVAEACAEKGYAETSVADLTTRAGVSTATFYKLFAGKLECALEAHGELFGRLLEEIEGACMSAGKRPDKVRAAVHAILELLAADPPTARLLTAEVMALGPEGVARNDAALESLATRLRTGREGGEDGAHADAEWAVIAGISMLLGKRVMAGDAATLPHLEDELVTMALALD
jgi:AcrR family transcriptional regulator